MPHLSPLCVLKVASIDELMPDTALFLLLIFCFVMYLANEFLSLAVHAAKAHLSADPNCSGTYERVTCKKQASDEWRLTEIANEHGSNAACGAIEMCRRVVHDADGRRILMVGHSQLPGHQLGIDLVVDLADLGEGHQRHGVCVDAEHESLLRNIQTAGAVQQLICSQQHPQHYFILITTTTRVISDMACAWMPNTSLSSATFRLLALSNSSSAHNNIHNTTSIALVQTLNKYR